MKKRTYVAVMDYCVGRIVMFDFSKKEAKEILKSIPKDEHLDSEEETVVCHIMSKKGLKDSQTYYMTSNSEIEVDYQTIEDEL